MSVANYYGLFLENSAFTIHHRRMRRHKNALDVTHIKGIFISKQ